ncbi:DNA binding, excisionase family domain protein [Mycolicibacterium canariasense]|uniref:DNA binding, excisionase family domain protein n=2 Tax=Mycobacteriaceae TaxID=1762 RepID=A0A100WAT4_MYCCR|nr:DNA binding, excisionase family domain protein [Mycolicibacterium canariasense]
MCAMTDADSNWIDPADYADEVLPSFWSRPPHWQQEILRQLQASRRHQEAEAQRWREQELPTPPDPPRATALEAAASMFGQPWHPGIQLHPLPAQQQAELEAAALRAGGVRQIDGPVYSQQVRMLTIAEAATALGTSASGVRRLISGGRLPKVTFGRTVRVRSDLVWALTHRPDLKFGADVYFRTDTAAYRPTAPAVDSDLGVPLAEVAKTMRVSEETVRRWSRQDPFTLPIVGRGPHALIKASLLATHTVPFKSSQLQLIDFAKIALAKRKTPEAKRAYLNALRVMAPAITPDQVRRTDEVFDTAAGNALWPMSKVAETLRLSLSGARKRVAAAGIRTQVIGGVARVRADDVMHLIYLRQELYAKQQGRPPVDPDDPNHIDLPTAAGRLGVTVRTLRRWIAAKRIEAITRADKLWVRADDVVALRRTLRIDKHNDRVAKAHAEAAPKRGAALTAEHMNNYMAWLEETMKLERPSEWIHTRRAAALLAGCRKSTIETLVREGLIPAMRDGHELRIRHGDLYAAGVFSARVARLCPNLRPSGADHGRAITRDFLALDFAARFLNRPLSQVKQLIRARKLHSVHFGTVHRIHASELLGLGRQKLEYAAGHYPRLRVDRWDGVLTVGEAADRLQVSERTVQRWYRRGALAGGPATKPKWKQFPNGAWIEIGVPINRGGLLLLDRHVEAARRARQVEGKVPRDPVPVTASQVRSEHLPQLMPWQQFAVSH